MLIKRQEADKWRKADLRAKLKSQKEGYLEAYKSKDEFDFPEISTSEMKRLKDKIRSDFRRERIKNIIILSISFLIMITLIVTYFLL